MNEEIYQLIELADDIEESFLRLSDALKNNFDYSELIHSLFRSCHSLKGNLLLLDKKNTAELVHSIENLLDQARKGNYNFDNDAIDLCLSGIDLVKTFISESNDSEIIKYTANEINNLLSSKPQTTEKIEKIFPLTEEEYNRLINHKDKKLFIVEKLLSGSISEEFYNNLPIFEDIKSIGELIAFYPKYENLNQSKKDKLIKILFVSDKTKEEISNFIFDQFREIKINYNDIEIIKTDKKQKPVDRKDKPKLPKILVVEDEEISLYITQKIMLNYGLCDTAINGTEALKKFFVALEEDNPYTILILDLMLPDINGYDLLNKFRVLINKYCDHIKKDLKVIIQTAKDDYEDIMKSFKMKCDGYLIKPIDKDKIANLFNKFGIKEINKLEI